jgi:hypothetical protein
MPAPTNAWTWTTISQALQLYLEEAPVGGQTTAEFQAALPIMVSNAELRIYRDIPFLAERGSNTSGTFTIGNRQFNLSSLTGQTISDGTAVAYPQPVSVEGIGAVVSGETVWFLRASLDWIDFVWPLPTQTAAPVLDSAYYAALSDIEIVVAPTPDEAYKAVVVGTWRPMPMSATNETTWLGTYLPDLFHDACMCEGEAYIRNYGAQADDPRAAMSWESTYASRLAPARAEEARRRGIPWPPAGAAPPPPQQPMQPQPRR